MKFKNMLLAVVLGSLQATYLFPALPQSDTEEKDQNNITEFATTLPEERSFTTIEEAFDALFSELEQVAALLATKSQSAKPKPNSKPTTTLKPASPQEMLSLLELRANKLREEYSRSLEAIEREAFDKKAALEKKYIKEIQTILVQMREVSALIND